LGLSALHKALAAVKPSGCSASTKSGDSNKRQRVSRHVQEHRLVVFSMIFDLLLIKPSIVHDIEELERFSKIEVEGRDHATWVCVDVAVPADCAVQIMGISLGPRQQRPH
jgi:hypothetical protein